jgi:hypothetical protein
MENQDMESVFDRDQADVANIPLAVVGAALGAAVGGLAWFAIEYFANYQVGFIALLCGAAAGWGAVTLGKGHGFQVGVIAAAFGLLGIVGGSYGSFVASKSKVRGEVKTALENQGAPAEQVTQTMKEVDDELAKVGYVDYMKDDTKRLMWMALFGVIGLAYGFKLGAGGLGGDDEPAYAPAYDDGNDDDVV